MCWVRTTLQKALHVKQQWPRPRSRRRPPVDNLTIGMLASVQPSLAIPCVAGGSARPADPGAGLYFQGGAPVLRNTQMVLQVGSSVIVGGSGCAQPLATSLLVV